MANEFKHKDPCTIITQVEYIGASGDGHIFACQAQGDILYATSTTVLNRLGKSGTSTHALTNTGTNNNPAWAQIALATGVSGTLPVANGGTGITSLASGVATFLGTPSSANLRSALTDETGTGGAVFATSPTLVTPALGTPASGVLTNATGLPTAGIVDNAVTLAKMAGITRGSIIYGDASGDPAALVKGGANEVLTSDGTDIAWAAADSPGAAKGYTTVASDGTIQANDYNVHGVTLSSACSGDYTVTWTTDFANVNYAIAATAEVDFTEIRTAAPGVGSVRILIFNSSGSAGDSAFHIIAHGDQ